MRILHLASFNGNIGDIANHQGFYNLWKKFISEKVEFVPLEIREFYKSWNVRQYDEELIEYINSFDLFVMGGGTFFDVKWEYSVTGTTINLSKQQLDQITCPIIINGMGVEISEKNSSQECIEKFKEFFEYILNNDNIIVSVRNDASKKMIEKYLGEKYMKKVYVIPDTGFFTDAKSYFHPEIKDGNVSVAINVAKDREDERWPDSQFDYVAYCKEMAAFINKMLVNRNDIRFVFVPHIPSDLEASYDVIKYLDDRHVRTRVTVAPYLNGGNTPGDYVVDLYRKCDLTIGMRYHSNICSIAVHTPTLAIFTFQKHVELYENIDLHNRIITVNKTHFLDEIYSKVNNLLDNKIEYKENNKYLIEEMLKDIEPYFMNIKKMLTRYNIHK